MFGFLTPLALFGLGLIAVPVLIHLFKPRRVRRTPFSSLRWLRASQHRTRRRIKWHQLLLLALRVAIICLMVLALAKPVISFDRGTGKADRFIILDVGRNMGYRESGEQVPVETGKLIAERLISHVIAGDRTTIMLAGSSARALGPLVGDASGYLQQLRGAQVEQGSADMAGVLRLIPTMVGKRSGSNIELFFVTDNSVHDWKQGAIAKFMTDTKTHVRVHVIQVGPDFGQNAWISDARLVESESPASRMIRIKIASVGGEHRKRTVHVTGLSSLPPMVKEILTGSGTEDVEFELPLDYELSGKIARVSLRPADALAADDTYWLNLDTTWSLRVLVIESVSTQIEELQAGFHLRMALNALSVAARGSPTIVRGEGTDVLIPKINEADLIVMADVPSLSSGNLIALEQRVRAGAGLVVFLGPSADVSFYNSKMHDPLRPASSLMPVRLGKKMIVSDTQRAVQISKIDWTHPVFLGLFDPIYGDIAQTRFNGYYMLDPVGKEQDRIIASIGDVAPAVIERGLGNGRVLVFNSTANDSWSDLPRRKSYVPLIDHVLKHMTAGTRRGTFTVGETAALPLPVSPTGDSASIALPGGTKVQRPIMSVAGGATVQLTDLKATGVYRVTYEGVSGPVSFPFVVNPGGNDGAMKRVAGPTLASWWQPADVRVTSPVPGSAVLELEGTRVLLDPWMILLVCMVFLAEMYFTHALCPKANPSVTSESTITAKGFFSQGTEDQEVTG